MRGSNPNRGVGRMLGPCLAALVAGAAMPAPAAHLSLTPAAPVVAPGDPLLLDLVVSDLGGAAVGDFDVDVSFDPTRLAFVGYALPTTLGDVVLGQALDFSLGETAPGVVDLAVVSTLPTATLEALQDDPFVLATLELALAGLAAGASTPVGLVLDALGDGGGGALPATLQGAVVMAIPEPGTAALLGPGLAGLAALARRRPPR